MRSRSSSSRRWTSGAPVRCERRSDAGRQRGSRWFVREIEQAITPGTSALALLVTHVREEALEQELTRFAGATLVRSDLPASTVERLRAALVAPAG